jgi:hypothetical protein
MARSPARMSAGGPGPPGFPPDAFAVALTCLPGMGPARLSAILRTESAARA